MSIEIAKWPIHESDEIAAVTNVLQSGCTNYWTGSECRQFEREFADYIGTAHAIALMNGTVALEAALYALDIGPGDEVITSCRTFIASASCIIMRGAIPVLADVDSDTQNITAKTIRSCISAKTKAIIVVHLAGWPADMEEIRAIADEFQLKVIEDCAQAHGARFKQKYVGAWGDVAAFSFCQDKIITTGGEGGMITTDDPVLWKKIWSYKDHGKSYDKVYHYQHPPGYKWLHDAFGTNWRMTEMQAAIGRIQLKKLNDWIGIRKRNAEILTSKFKGIPGIRLTLPNHDIDHAYYKYYVFIRPEELSAGWNRDRIMQNLNAEHVICMSGSCGEIYLEGAFKHYPQLHIEPCPVAHSLGETSLAFFVHPSLSELEMVHIADSLVTVMNEATK